MLKLNKLICTTTVVALTCSAAATAQTEEFVFATGSQGGSWFPVGGVIQSIVEEKYPDVTMTVTPGAGVANVVGVDAGRFPIAFANSISTVDGQEGRAPFRKATTNVCNLGVLYPQWFQIITLDSAGVESIEDFEGKRLTTQQHGHTGEILTRSLLGTAGLSYEDLEDVSHLSYSGSVIQMKDGHADIFTLGTSLPAGSVMDLASSRDIDIVPISDEVFNHFKQQNAAFQKRVVEAGSYPGVDEDVPAITYDTHLVADCDFSPEIVKAVLTAIADNTDAFGSVNSAMANLTPEQMATDIGVPLHPAAEEFYRERGAL